MDSRILTVKSCFHTILVFGFGSLATAQANASDPLDLKGAPQASLRFGQNKHGKQTTLLGESTFPIKFACASLGGEEYRKAGMNTVLYEFYADTATEMKVHTYETLFEKWDKELQEVSDAGYQVIIYIHVTNHDRHRLGYFRMDDEWKNLISRMVSEFRDLPNLAGWAFADEIADHAGNPDDLFQEFLRSKYGDIGSLNEAWDKEFVEFSDIRVPYKDKDLMKGTGTPTGEAMDPKYPLGLSRMAFDAADFKLYRIRHTHKIFEETVRAIDPDTPLWSGAHNLAWAAAEVPKGWGAWHDAYPTYSGDDWFTHHAWFQGVLRGQNYRPVIPMLMIETSNPDPAAKWNLDPRTWGGWMVQAALQGSSGISFWPWSLLAVDRSPGEIAPPERRSAFVGETLRALEVSGIFELKPDNTVAVLYQPYAEGWAGVSQVYGVLPTPPGTPLALMKQLAFGTQYGSVDYLTNDTLMAADLDAYGLIIAPFAADIPPAVQSKIEEYVGKGGVILADAGFSAKGAKGNLLSMTAEAAKLFGIKRLSSSRFEREWTLSEKMPTALQDSGFLPRFKRPLSAFLSVTPDTAEPVFVGPDGQGLFVNEVGEGAAYFFSGILHNPATLEEPNLRLLHATLFANRANIKKRIGNGNSVLDNARFFNEGYQVFKYVGAYAVANLTDSTVEAEFEVEGKVHKVALSPYETRLYRGEEVHLLPGAFFPSPGTQ